MPNWLKTAAVAVVIFFLLPLSWVVATNENKTVSYLYSIVIAVILVAFASVILAKIITNDIDVKYLISEDNGNASLSRFQFLLFTFVIAASYFLFVTAIITSGKFDSLIAANTPIKLPDIPTSVLGLIGISGGSYVISKGIQKSSSGSSVVEIHITNGGTGYAAPPTVTIVGGGGAGATATAVVNAGGVVTGINVTSPGGDYSSTPSVQIAGVGTGATAVAELG